MFLSTLIRLACGFLLVSAFNFASGQSLHEISIDEIRSKYPSLTVDEIVDILAKEYKKTPAYIRGYLGVRTHDEDYYQSCVLENTIKGIDKNVLAAVKQACEHKANPKVCRDSQTPVACLEQCRKAGAWSRNFGDCAKG